MARRVQGLKVYGTAGLYRNLRPSHCFDTDWDESSTDAAQMQLRGSSHSNVAMLILERIDGGEKLRPDG